MPLNLTDILPAPTLSKDLVADQTWYNVHRLLGTTAMGFQPAKGLGVWNGAAPTNTSIMFALGIGGFNDMLVTGLCYYDAAVTAPGNEDLGILGRFLTNHTPNATYYYARVDGQQAKITRIADGVFTTLTQSPFALPAGEDVTITLQCVGGVLTATFTATTPAPVALQTDDSAAPTYISGPGLCAFRTQNSSGWCKSLAMQEV